MRQVFYYKMRQFYYRMRQLLQNATIFLQNATVITKCDAYYKLRQYKDNLKLPRKRKVLSHYEEEEEAPEEFVSKVEEYYLHFFIKQLK